MLSDTAHRTNILAQAAIPAIQIQKPIVIYPPLSRPPKKYVVASAQVSKRPAPEPPADIDAYLHRYAGEFNLDAGLLHRIANCESHFNPGSVSGSGAYGGMFQFSASTWQSTRNAMSLDPNPDLRFNAEEAIRTAAFKISHGGLGAWPVCGQR
jgi:soluble lytic murein transglycosylase-like protein